MSVVERVHKHALELDAPAVDDVLRRLSDVERDEVRTWLVRGRGRRLVEDVHAKEHGLLYEQTGSGAWINAMCAIAVCSPVEAVKTVRWRELWVGGDQLAARSLALARLEDRPREWGASFVEAASTVTLPKDIAWQAGRTLTAVVARAVLHHGLPCPSGLTFVSHYLQDDWQRPVDADRLRAEPLMPDIVHHMISAGVIANLAALPEVAPVLVEEGRLDRARLVDSCLSSLTVDQRVRSQRVVAKTLSALGVRAEEVPGGLSFLVGVIATRDGSVGAVLLPLALGLVVDAAGLEELTRVVAGRREKKQKQVLLTSLRDPSTTERAGLDGVLRSLEILAEGEDDAGLLQGVDAARTELGAPVDADERETMIAGLWLLDPEPRPEPDWPWWVRREGDVVVRYLDRRKALNADTTDVAVSWFVRGMTNGSYEADGVATLCHDLQVGGHLAVTRLVTLFEAAFLAGGLRTMWPAALAVADDLAGANRSPAGLPDLLRMLTRYAHEVPDGQVLPDGLLAVAAGGGSTKVQLEARALGAALARVDVAAYRPETPAAESPDVRGLWALRVPVPVLARLADPAHAFASQATDAGLGRLLDLAVAAGDRASKEDPRETPLRDDRALRWLAVTVQREGLSSVRERVARHRSSAGLGPAALALDGWQRGAVDAATYDVDSSRAWRELPPGPDRLVFAWWREQLVRLPTHPGLLCMPDSNIGTVDLEQLVGRIRYWHGIAEVGPLDLVLALTRLRPPAPDRDDQLARLDGLELWTDPLTGPTFDVVPVVRRWVQSGGFDAPELPLDVALVPGLDEADLRGRATHPDVLARVRPRDPSLGAGPPESLFGRFQPPVLVDGRISHDWWTRYLLKGMCDDHAYSQDRALSHLVDLAQHDVLAPEVMVPAALSWLERGHLPLARFTESLQWVFERGGLRALWPLALEVAGAAANRTPKPNGLAVLVGSLATYASEVPIDQRTVPDGVRALAGSKGSTKSHAAARDLVAVLQVAS